MDESGDSKLAESPASSEAGPIANRSRPPLSLRSVAAMLRVQPWLLYVIYFFCAGTLMYVAGVLMVFPRYLLGLYKILTPVAEWLVWYSGLPIVLGLVLALIDLLFLFERKRPPREYRDQLSSNARVTVALTAWNDEESIGEAVRDFLAHQGVARVIVVSNNSSDHTLKIAEAAGALTFNEEKPG